MPQPLSWRSNERADFCHTVCTDVTPSIDIEKEITTQARKLESFYRSITSCRVLVEASERHRQKGYPYHIRIDLTVPGGEIVVKRAPTSYAAERHLAGQSHRKAMEIRPERRNLKLAIRESFDTARRRLQDHARKRRAQVKTHEPAPEGRVSKLFPAEDFGYVETADGREIYFQANSVMNRRFKSLKIGSIVRFAEERGEKGPQASTVQLVTKTSRHRAPVQTRSRY
jgi:cold shock CspA family protein